MVLFKTINTLWIAVRGYGLSAIRKNLRLLAGLFELLHLFSFSGTAVM
jgi:hypothetical protein